MPSFAAPSGLRPMSKSPSRSSAALVAKSPHTTRRPFEVPNNDVRSQAGESSDSETAAFRSHTAEHGRSEFEASQEYMSPDELAKAISSCVLPELESRLLPKIIETIIATQEHRTNSKSTSGTRGTAEDVAEVVCGSLANRFQSLERAVASLLSAPLRMPLPEARRSISATEIGEQAPVQLRHRRSSSLGLLSVADSDVEERLSVFTGASLQSNFSKVRRMPEHTTAEKRFLRRAFVINFRRLMEVQKVLAILHELIKSTAIAALTLVLAQDYKQLSYSILFVVILQLMYAFHAARYVTMDVENYRLLGQLLEDDDGYCAGRKIQNPNRLLKALTIAPTGRRKRRLAIIVTLASCCFILWCLVCLQWSSEVVLTGVWKGFLTDQFYATLLLIGTIMLAFHVVFEWLYWRETQCIMPLWDQAAKEPWDPQKRGLPRRYNWFGLPSMWFTCPEAYQDLATWIAHSKKLANQKGNHKVFPEEMAIFALDAENACQLRQNLYHAKLYSVQAGTFLLRSGCEMSSVSILEDPEELCIELMFYDSQTKEYLQPGKVPDVQLRAPVSQLATPNGNKAEHLFSRETMAHRHVDERRRL